MILPPRYASPTVAFDGSTSYIDCGNVKEFTDLTDYTLEAWVSLATLAGVQSVIGKTNNSATAFQLYLNNGYVFASYPGNPRAVTSPQPITAADWHHLAVTYDGVHITLYVDGVLVDQQPYKGPPLNSSADVVVGAVLNGTQASQFFNGRIGSVMFWSTARTAEQILIDAVQVSSIDAPAEEYLELHVDFTMLPMVDRSGNGAPVVAHGGITHTVAIAGLVLDGKSAWANGGSNEDLDFAGTAPYTVEGWFFPSSTVTGYIASKGQGPNAQYALVYQNGAQIVAARNTDGHQIVSGPMAPNVWYHVAMSYDGGNTDALTLYVNGNVQSVEYFPSDVKFDPGPFTIGATTNNSGQGVSLLTGYVQNMRVWSIALTQAQINQWMYNQPVDTPGLSASFDFTVSPPVDTTAQNPLTLVGDARAAYQSVALASNDPVVSVGLPAAVNAVYLNAEPVAPPPPPAQLSVAPQPQPLGDQQREASWQAFVERRRALHKNAPGDAERGRFDDAWERARTMVRENPALLQVFTREERDGALSITYHGVNGDVLMMQGAAPSIPPCTQWWIQFVFQVTIGFMQALDLVPSTGDIATRVYKLITANAAVVAVMDSMVGRAITVSGALSILSEIYAQGLMWSVIKFALTSAGWWSLFWLVKKILQIISGEEEVALMAGFMVWAAQMSLLSESYHTACGTTQPS